MRLTSSFFLHSFLERHLSSHVGNDEKDSCKNFQLCLNRAADSQDTPSNERSLLRTLAGAIRTDWTQYALSDLLLDGQKKACIVPVVSSGHMTVLTFLYEGFMIMFCNTGMGLSEHHDSIEKEVRPHDPPEKFYEIIQCFRCTSYDVFASHMLRIQTLMQNKKLSNMDFVYKLLIEPLHTDAHVHRTVPPCCSVPTSTYMTAATTTSSKGSPLNFGHKTLSSERFVMHKQSPTGTMPSYSRLFALPQMTGSCTYSSMLWTLFAFMPSYEAVLRLENAIRWHTLQALDVPGVFDLTALEFSKERCIAMTMRIEHGDFVTHIQSVHVRKYMSDLIRNAPLHEENRRRDINALFNSTKTSPTKWMVRSDDAHTHELVMDRNRFVELVASRGKLYKSANVETLIQYIMNTLAVITKVTPVDPTDAFVVCCMASTLLDVLLSWTLVCVANGREDYLTLKTLSYMSSLDSITIVDDTINVEEMMMLIARALFAASIVRGNSYFNEYRVKGHVEQTALKDTTSLCIRCFSLLAVLNTSIPKERAMPTSESNNARHALQILLANNKERTSKSIPFTQHDLHHFASFKRSGLLLDGSSLLTSCNTESPYVDPVMTYASDEFRMNESLSHFPARAAILLATLGISALENTWTVKAVEFTLSLKKYGHVMIEHPHATGNNIYMQQLITVNVWLNDSQTLLVLLNVILQTSDSVNYKENFQVERLYTSEHVRRMVHVPQSIDDIRVARTENDLREYLDYTFHCDLEGIYNSSWAGKLTMNDNIGEKMSLSYDALAFRKWQEYAAKRVLMHKYTMLRFKTEDNPVSVAYLLLLYTSHILYMLPSTPHGKKLKRMIDQKLTSPKLPVWLEEALQICKMIFDRPHRKRMHHVLQRSLRKFDHKNLYDRVVQALLEVLLKMNPVAAFDAMDDRTGRSMSGAKHGSIVTFPKNICFEGMHVDMVLHENDLQSLSEKESRAERCLVGDKRATSEHKVFVSREGLQAWNVQHLGKRYTFGSHIERNADGATFMGRCPYDHESLWFVTLKLDLAGVPADVWRTKEGLYQVETQSGVFVVKDDDIYWRRYSIDFTEKDITCDKSLEYTDGSFLSVRRAEAYEDTPLKTWTNMAQAAVFVVKSSVVPSTEKEHTSRCTDSLLVLTSSTQEVRLEDTPFDKSDNANERTTHSLKSEACLLRMHPSYLYPDFGSCSPREIALLYILGSASCNTECTARLWWSLHVIRLLMMSARRTGSGTAHANDEPDLSRTLHNVASRHIMGSPYRWMQPALIKGAYFTCCTERQRRRINLSNYFDLVVPEESDAAQVETVMHDAEVETHIHHRARAFDKVNEIIRRAVPLSRLGTGQASDATVNRLGTSLYVVGDVKRITQKDADVLSQACGRLIDDRTNMIPPAKHYQRIVWPLTDVHTNDVIICKQVLDAFHHEKLFRDVGKDEVKQLEKHAAFRRVQRFHPSLLVDANIADTTKSTIKDVLLFENSACKLVSRVQYLEAVRFMSDGFADMRPIRQAIMGVGKSSVIVPLLCLLYIRHATGLNMLILVQPTHLVRDCLETLFKSFSAIGACIEDVLGGEVHIRVATHPNEAFSLPQTSGRGDEKNSRTFTIVCLDDVSMKNIWLMHKVQKRKSEAYTQTRVKNEGAEPPWNPTTTAVLFDEVDAMYDPLSAQLNIPEGPIQHPVLKTKEQMDALYAMIISSIKPEWVKHLPYTAADARRILSTVRAEALTFLQKIDMDLVSTQVMQMNLHFGDSCKRTSRFAVPYVAVKTPSPDSQFSDCDLTIILTCRLKILEGLQSDDLAQLQEYLTAKVKLFAQVDSQVLATIKTNYIADACSIATPGSYLNDVFLRMTAAQLYSHDMGAVAKDERCIRFYLLHVLLPSLRVHRNQWNMSFLDLMQADVCHRHMLGMSGTLRMRPVTCAALKEKRHIVSLMQSSDHAHASIELIVRGYQDVGLKGVYAKRREDIVFSCDGIQEVLSASRNYDCVIDACACLRTVHLETIRKVCAETRAFTFIDERDEKKTILPSGEPVSSFTPDAADDVFTFFDQKHSRGTDLILHMRTRGLVILDATSACISETAQAMFRLRQLHYGQVVDFCVIPRRPDSPRNTDDLYECLVRNENMQMRARSQMHDVQMWKAVVRTLHYGAAHDESVPYLLNNIDDPAAALDELSGTMKHPPVRDSENLYVHDLLKEAKTSIIALHNERRQEHNLNDSSSSRFTVMTSIENTQKQQVQQQNEVEHMKARERNGGLHVQCIEKVAPKTVFEVSAGIVSYSNDALRKGEFEKAMESLKISRTPLVYTSNKLACMVIQYEEAKTCVICCAAEVLVKHAEEEATTMYQTDGTQIFCEDCNEAAVSKDAHVLLACMFAGGNLSVVSHAHLIRGALEMEDAHVDAVKTILRCLLAASVLQVLGRGVMKMWEDFAMGKDSTMRSLHADFLRKCQEPRAFAQLFVETVTDESIYFLENQRHKAQRILSSMEPVSSGS